MTIQQICVHLRSSAVKNSRSLLNTLRSLRSLRCMIFLTAKCAKDAKISSVCLVDEYSNKNLLKNHREHRGHREKQRTSVLFVSSVVDYTCSTSINVNAIERGLNSLNINYNTKVNKNDNYCALKYE